MAADHQRDGQGQSPKDDEGGGGQVREHLAADSGLSQIGHAMSATARSQPEQLTAAGGPLILPEPVS